MKKVNELRAGALLSYVNIAITTIIPLLYTPIMLKMLGQSEYGLYSLSNSIISYLSILNFGMGSAVVRYITAARAEENKDKVERTMGLFLKIYGALALLVLIVGGVITIFVDSLFAKGLSVEEINKLRILMIIMSVSTAISFPLSVCSSVLISYEKYIFRRILDITSTVMLPILNLVVLFMGEGSIGMAAVGLVIQIIYGYVYIHYCKRKIGVKAKYDKLNYDMLKEIWGFTAFVFLGMIVDMLYWATDKVLIGALIGSVAVAVYNIGGVFTSMVNSMSSAISNVFSSRITTMVVKDQPIEKLSELLIRIGRIQYLVIAFIISGYIVFGKAFIHFWSGDAYMEAYYIALYTMIPLAIPLIQNVAYNTILAQKKHKFRSIIYAIIAVVNVISTYMAIPRYGIIGAAVCTAIAYVIGNGIIMNIYYYKVTKLDIPKFWLNIAKISIVPVIFSMAGLYIVNKILIINSIKLFLIEVIVYSVLYIVCIWLTSMNQYEKSIFYDMIKFIKKK